MNKKVLSIIIVVASLLIIVFSINWISLNKPLSEALKSDQRNDGIEVISHYEIYVNPSVVVFDIKNVGNENSRADVFRVLMQFSERMKDRDYEQILLSYRGTVKFQIKGSYFKQLGNEFGEQNSIYTIRTFPENLYKPDGSKAFGSWSGGIFAVLGKQMEDFNEFHNQWYIKDISSVSGG